MATTAAKKKWDETMAASGILRHNQIKQKTRRRTGRTVKLSRAMKTVDEETRQFVRNARLDSLEADNHIDNEQQTDNDDLYEEEEEDSRSKVNKESKRRKQPTTKPKKRWRVKNINQTAFEEYGEGIDNPPNYVSVAASASKYPARRYCCVCGLFSCYSCSRCGSKYCSINCGDHHKESGCLKFNF